MPFWGCLNKTHPSVRMNPQSTCSKRKLWVRRFPVKREQAWREAAHLVARGLRHGALDAVNESPNGSVLGFALFCGLFKGDQKKTKSTTTYLWGLLKDTPKWRVKNMNGSFLDPVLLHTHTHTHTPGA